MPILHVVLILVVIGVVLWLIDAYVPMKAEIKRIMMIFVIIAVVLWLLNMFIPLGSLGTIRTPSR